MKLNRWVAASGVVVLAVVGGVVGYRITRPDATPVAGASGKSGPTVTVIPTLSKQSTAAVLLDGGLVVGNDSYEYAPEEPWVYQGGKLRVLPVGLRTGHVDLAVKAGYAGGWVKDEGEEVAARWKLSDGSVERLAVSYSSVTGMNAAGDAVITAQNAAEVRPLTGAPISLGPASNAMGLTANRQTMLFRYVGQHPTWHLAGARLPVPEQYGCYVSVNDAGYTVYQPNWRTEPVRPKPAELRTPDGTLQNTGLYLDCRQHLLSADGQVVGLVPGPDGILGLAAQNAHIGRWAQGRLTDLGLPATDAVGAWPSAVNDAGDALATYFTRAAPQRPRIAVHRRGAWEELPVPSSPDDPTISVAGVGLNDTGQAVGWYQTKNNVVKSVLWQL